MLASWLRDTLAAAASTAPAAGSQRGCRCSGEPAACNVAFDRDATERGIALARTFGTRGRVLISPEDLGPKGDLNDWLRVGAKGDPTVFRSILERALQTSATPWALQIQRLPPDLAPWDLEDYPGVRDLLCEIGRQGPLSRDAHLRLVPERCGWRSSHFKKAVRELAQARAPHP